MHRALAAACRAAGYRMRHVADEPARFGAEPSTPKVEGGTLTSWLVCYRGAEPEPGG